MEHIHPSRREVTIVGSHNVLIAAYVVLITAAEACVVFLSAVAGAVCYSILLVAMLTHCAVGLAPSDDRPSTGERFDPVHAVAALAFVPILRLVSLSASVGGGTETSRYLIVGGALLAGVAWGAWGVRLPGLRLRPRYPAIESAVALLGFPLAFGAYRFVRPESVAAGTHWFQLAAAALAVGLAAVVEELIFRGFIQTAFARWHGPRLAPLLSAGVYIVAYLGVRPVQMIALSGILGLLFGWIVERSRSLLGVTVSHVIVNVGLFVLLPYAAWPFLR